MLTPVTDAVTVPEGTSDWQTLYDDIVAKHAEVAAAFDPVAAVQDAGGNAADADLLSAAAKYMRGVQFPSGVDGSLMRLERVSTVGTLRQARFEGTGAEAGTVYNFTWTSDDGPVPLRLRVAPTASDPLAFLRFDLDGLAADAVLGGRLIANANTPGVTLNGLHASYGALTAFVAELRAFEPYDREALKTLVEDGVLERTNIVVNASGVVTNQTIAWPGGPQVACPSTLDVNGRLSLIRIPYARLGADVLVSYTYFANGGEIESVDVVDTGDGVPA